MNERDELMMLRRLAELEAKAQGVQSPKPTPKKPEMDPSEGRLALNFAGWDTGLTMPQGVSRFMAGLGKSVVDTGRGLGQIANLVSREEVAEARKRDAALMNTGAGMAGDITGNIGMALAPGGFLKGAAVGATALKAPAAVSQGLSAAGSAILAPRSIQGAVALGAGMGVIQPSTSTTETIANTAIGGVASGVVPAAVRGYQSVKSTLEPFYDAGKKKIVGRTLAELAGGEGDRALQNLTNARELVPGSLQTVGQAAGVDSLAALERTASQVDPIIMNRFADRMRAQNTARIDAVKGIIGTKAEREAEKELVEKTAKSLYGQAFKENVPVTDELSRLAARPSMRRAEARAVQLADELEIPFQARLDDMRPRHIPLGAQEPTPSAYLKETIFPGSPMPAGGTTPPVRNIEEVRVPGDMGMPSYFELPPVDSVPVRDMHTMKMGMDALMSDPTLGIKGREAAAINATREKLLNLLPESYQTARQAHIDLNRPINQRDIASEVLEQSLDTLTGKLKPRTFAKALTDDTAKTATGLKNAKLDQIMSKEQLSILNAIKDDLRMSDFAMTAGRPIGSDTVQKLAYSNMLNRTGIPNWMREWGPTQLVGNVLGRSADLAYARANRELSTMLAESLLNPKTAAGLLGDALSKKQSDIGGLLSRTGASGGMMVPGLLNFNKE